VSLYDQIGVEGTSAATTIATGTLPLGAPPAGTLILIAVAQGGNGTGAATISGFSVPTGLSVLSLPASAASHITILAKIAGASEPNGYTATLNSSNFASIQYWAFIGRNTGGTLAAAFTALSSTVAGAIAASPLSIAFTGVTAATGDDILWVSALSNSQGNGYPGPTFTPPSGFSSALTDTSTTSFTVGLVGACQTNVVGGTTGTLTGSMAYTGGGSNSWGGYVISIAKAPIMSNIVQQTGVWSFGDTITCPAFGSAVTAGDAIALVAYLFPVALAISSSPVVSDGTANVYKLATIFMQPTHTWPITFTASPTGTAGTLNANFAGATGTTCTIVFSDGEIRRASVTNGNTAVTWTTAISGTPTVNAIAYDNIPCMAMWLAQNSVAGTVTPQFVTTLGGTQALYAAEITNVGTGNILLGTSGNIQFGPGTSPNAINSGSVAVSQTGVLFGFCFDQSTITTVAIAGGTGFVAQSAVWNSGTVVCAMAEDATINTSTAATFTALTAGTHGSDTFYSLAMALAGPGPFTPFTQTQFFVTDTIVQQ